MAQRLFVAVDLPDEVRSTLESVQISLRHDIGNDVRWVSPESIHLTLRFLGDTEESLMPVLRERLERIGSGFAPVTLALSQVGAFPNRNRPRVIWVGMEEQEGSQLTSLQSQIERLAVSLGFAREERSFSPHLTLGRVRQGLSREALERISAVLANARKVPKLTYTATEVCLMQSQLTPRGAIYTCLAAVPLAG